MNRHSFSLPSWQALGLCLPTLLLAGSCAQGDQKGDSPASSQNATVGRAVSSTRAIRVVACDARVQSSKRGVGANKMDAADFKALSPGVSWFYNWHFEPGGDLASAKGSGMEFIPMVWGKDEDSRKGLEAYLAAGHKPRAALGINEPNLSEQALMSPEKAAELYGQIKTITNKYRIPLVGPQMSIGSPPNMSVTAQDPIENKELTYTYMLPYLKAFFYYTDKAGLKVDAFGMHPYMNAGGLIGLTDLMHTEFQRPVWVTEFNISDEGAGMDDTRTYLIKVVDFMERQPYVHGYAFFKERAGGHPRISLLGEAPGTLTPLGDIYVNMPVHDADLYYRVPGTATPSRLQAENYAATSKTEIWPTSDVDGFTHMSSNEAGSSLDYNFQVDKAGKYTMRFRVTGAPGSINVLSGDQVLGTAAISPDLPRWATVETAITLPAGLQTLRVRCDAAGIGLNWIELSRS